MQHEVGIRPVFRKLGDAAALVYEAIERANGFPHDAAEVVRRARISRTTVEKVLAELAGYGIICRDTGQCLHITHTRSLPRKWGPLPYRFASHISPAFC